MTTILLTIVIALLVFAAMSLGIMFGRQPIKGSCGGIASGQACDLCGGNPTKCPKTDPEN